MSILPFFTLSALEIGQIGIENRFPTPGSARMIGPVHAHVTVAELHFDELAITQHPVETGAAITDHAFKRPSVLRIEAGWSPSYGSSRGIVPSSSDVSLLRAMFQQLLDLQINRTLLAVETGKRSYKQMLLNTISEHTRAQTENSLIIEMTLREVILVSTSKVTIPDAAKQKFPTATAGTEDSGIQSIFPTVPPTAQQYLMTPPSQSQK